MYFSKIISNILQQSCCWCLVIAIKVQGGPDGYIEKFQIGFKETPEEFQYIRDTNNKIVVRYY
jgi:hypothetical protein